MAGLLQKKSKRLGNFGALVLNGEQDNM